MGVMGMTVKMVSKAHIGSGAEDAWARLAAAGGVLGGGEYRAEAPHECEGECGHTGDAPTIDIAFGARQDAPRGWEWYAAQAAREEQIIGWMTPPCEGSAFAGGTVNLPWRGDGTAGAGVPMPTPTVRRKVDGTIIDPREGRVYARERSGTSNAAALRRNRAVKVDASETPAERLQRLASITARSVRHTAADLRASGVALPIATRDD